MPLTTGQLLTNRYRITRRLHVGGMGAIYEAYDLNLSMPVAVKENAVTDRDGERQFREEALLLAQLNHDNLPRVTDHFVISGEGQYLVMELVPGNDLQEALDRRATPFTLADLLPTIRQMCAALTYLHNQPEPIIHRDIKPANIRITPDGRVYLVDFGISKRAVAGSDTGRGARAVSPGFSLPEQYGNGRTNARSDIYALAATIYALVNGREPPESVHRHGAATLPDPPGLPAYAAAALARGLALDPDKRFESAAEFLAALEGRQSNQTQPLPDPSATGSRSWLFALPILLLLGMGALFGWRTLAGNNNTGEPTRAVIAVYTPADDSAPATLVEETNAVAGGNGITVETMPEEVVPATDLPPTPTLPPTATPPSPTPEPTVPPSPPTPRPTEASAPAIMTAVPRMRPPTAAEQSALPKFWDYVRFRDIQTPGTEEYSLRVDSNELIRWTFAWCAGSRDELYTILQPLTVRFFADGSEIGIDRFDVYETWVDSSRCQMWNSVIYDWNGIPATELEIRYDLATNISEGGNVYLQGTYRHILQLRIEE